MKPLPDDRARGMRCEKDVEQREVGTVVACGFFCDEMFEMRREMLSESGK